MTTGQIVFGLSVLAVTALMVWAIRVAQVRESLPAMTATERVRESSQTGEQGHEHQRACR